jgi:hypothetical protein
MSVSQKKPRAPRIRVQPLHHITLTDDQSHQALGIYNLSVSGMGILVPPKLVSRFVGGAKINAHLAFADESPQPILLEVIHSHSAVTGTRVLNASAELKMRIDTFFEVELLAVSMFRMDPKLMNPVKQGDPYWVQGDQNCSLFYVVGSDGTIQEANLSFIGNLVEFHKGKKPRIGQVEVNLDIDRTTYQDSTLVNWSEDMPAAMKTASLRFVESISCLDSAHRALLVDLLKTVPVQSKV